ncbi:MAG: MFS transporter [Alphaproteobacteria bacterium]|nr:MFS transporter [Alphaproteobacteria bacterium]
MSKKYSDNSVKRGLAWLRLGWFFHNFLLISPVIVLIYTQKGITVGDFFLIQGIFRLAAFLFEIPSGYLSDCFSRKRVMITGAFFALFGFVALALANGFWGLILGEALLGVASALFSGTLEAYTYDLMKRNKTQKQFLKEFGSITTWGGVASFVSVILGGILYAYIGGNGLLWLMAMFGILVVFCFLFLPELSEIKRVVKHKGAITDAVSITYKTLRNAKLRNLILFPSLFGAFTIVLLWIMQPIMETAHVPVALFGFYMGINHLSAIFFAKYAYKICGKLGEITVSLLTIGTLIMGITMGLLATHIQSMPVVYIACGIMAITPAIRMLNNLQYNTLIHHSIKSVERGTVLSTRAMVSTVLGAAFLIVAKFLMDGYGITTTLLFAFGMILMLVWSLKNVSKYIG